jgi:hypothetical protein
MLKETSNLFFDEEPSAKKESSTQKAKSFLEILDDEDELFTTPSKPTQNNKKESPTKNIFEKNGPKPTQNQKSSLSILDDEDSLFATPPAKENPKSQARAQPKSLFDDDDLFQPSSLSFDSKQTTNDKKAVDSDVSAKAEGPAAIAEKNPPAETKSVAVSKGTNNAKANRVQSIFDDSDDILFPTVEPKESKPILATKRKTLSIFDSDPLFGDPPPASTSKKQASIFGDDDNLFENPKSTSLAPPTSSTTTSVTSPSRTIETDNAPTESKAPLTQSGGNEKSEKTSAVLLGESMFDDLFETPKRGTTPKRIISESGDDEKDIFTTEKKTVTFDENLILSESKNVPAKSDESTKTVKRGSLISARQASIGDKISNAMTPNSTPLISSSTSQEEG